MRPRPLWMPKELDPCPVAVREHKPHPFLRVLLEACCLPRSLEDVVAVLQWQQCNTYFQTSSDLPINNLQESQWGLLNGCHMLNLVETLPPTMRSGLIKILKIKKKIFLPCMDCASAEEIPKTITEFSRTSFLGIYLQPYVIFKVHQRVLRSKWRI